MNHVKSVVFTSPVSVLEENQKESGFVMNARMMTHFSLTGCTGSLHLGTKENCCKTWMEFNLISIYNFKLFITVLVIIIVQV